VGDPGDPSNRTVRVTLAARIPGLLEIAESGREVDTVWAADLGPDGAADLEFEAEGFADVPLGLPARASGFVTEVRATIAAAPPPERARPPVGPPAGARAELLLGPDRAACVRVPADLPFADLAAVRLPLAAGPSGAEVQVGFLAAGARPSDPPGELVPTSLAKPVVLPPAPAGAAAGAAAAGEQWTSFTLAAPLPLPQLTGAPRPWLAVFVSRGEATWGMAAGEGFTGFALPTDIRRGPAGGPWEPLPAYLAAPPGSAARVHFVGRASKQEPVAPLAIEAAVADSPWRSDAPDRRDVVPSAKGARATLACNLALSPPSGAVLRVTALCAGTVTIRNLETVVSTAPAAPQEE
jgi:hypothetical protein